MTKEKEATIKEELENAKVEESDDDLFEKILNEDINPPTDDDDKDAGTGESSDKEAEKEKSEEDKHEDSEDVESLKAEIERLKKEAKGRLNDVVKSRQEKRQFQSELDQLKGAVQTLLEKRNPADDSTNKDEGEGDELEDVAKVEFGENDSAYVDLSKVKKAISTETEKTRAELEQLRLQEEIRKAQEAYQKNVQAIIGEDKDVFEPAYDKLKDTFRDLNDSIIELQQRTGEMGDNGVLSTDEALDLFSGSPEETEFLKSHPGVDPTRVARAFNSKVDLRTSLRHVADVFKIGVKDEAAGLEQKIDQKLEHAKRKPRALGGTENRDTKTSDLIERISQLDYKDMESMSDAEAAKIEQLLLQQELKGE
jgi:chromosome segregation ATPase